MGAHNCPFGCFTRRPGFDVGYAQLGSRGQTIPRSISFEYHSDVRWLVKASDDRFRCPENSHDQKSGAHSSVRPCEALTQSLTGPARLLGQWQSVCSLWDKVLYGSLEGRVRV
jgi:hypothetical protein